MVFQMSGLLPRDRLGSWNWVFDKGTCPSLIISALEALAVLVALKLYHGEQLRTHQTQVMVVPRVDGQPLQWSCLEQDQVHKVFGIRGSDGAVSLREVYGDEGAG